MFNLRCIIYNLYVFMHARKRAAFLARRYVYCIKSELVKHVRSINQINKSLTFTTELVPSFFVLGKRFQAGWVSS